MLAKWTGSHKAAPDKAVRLTEAKPAPFELIPSKGKFSGQWQWSESVATLLGSSVGATLLGQLCWGTSAGSLAGQLCWGNSVGATQANCHGATRFQGCSERPVGQT
jgi:hypothetical protein